MYFIKLSGHFRNIKFEHIFQCCGNAASRCSDYSNCYILTLPAPRGGIYAHFFSFVNNFFFKLVYQKSQYVEKLYGCWEYFKLLIVNIQLPWTNISDHLPVPLSLNFMKTKTNRPTFVKNGTTQLKSATIYE